MDNKPSSPPTTRVVCARSSREKIGAARGPTEMLDLRRKFDLILDHPGPCGHQLFLQVVVVVDPLVPPARIEQIQGMMNMTVGAVSIVDEDS